ETRLRMASDKGTGEDCSDCGDARRTKAVAKQNAKISFSNTSAIISGFTVFGLMGYRPAKESRRLGDRCSLAHFLARPRSERRRIGHPCFAWAEKVSKSRHSNVCCRLARAGSGSEQAEPPGPHT